MKAMRSIFTVLALAVALHGQGTPQFVVHLNGKNVLPPNDSLTQGEGPVYLADGLLWPTIVLPLGFPRDARAVIRGPAGSNDVGPVLLDLGRNTFIPPDLPYGSGGNTFFSRQFSLTAPQIDELAEGLWYIEVYTRYYPYGEVRGQIVPVPVNDRFATAMPLAGVRLAVTNLFTPGLPEAGAPTAIAQAAYSALWFRWTAPTNGPVTVSTNGSTFAAGLTVFTGTALTNLVLLASQDPPSPPEPPEPPEPKGRKHPYRLQSTGPSGLTFAATNGRTYYFAITGDRATPQSLAVLTLDQPAAPFFARQPAGGAVVRGDTFLLSANVLGSPALSWQWTLNGTNLAGATASAYRVAALGAEQAGNYLLTAWNDLGTNTSVAAPVQVLASGAGRLVGTLDARRQFLLQQSDVTNYQYLIQATTNLAGTNWVTLTNVGAAGPTNTVPYTFTDPQASNYPMRFYRSVFQGQ